MMDMIKRIFMVTVCLICVSCAARPYDINKDMIARDQHIQFIIVKSCLDTNCMDNK